MASMPDVNKTELSVRVSNETYVAINKIAAGSGVGRATLVRRWLEVETGDTVRNFTMSDMIKVVALRDRHERERKVLAKTKTIKAK